MSWIFPGKDNPSEGRPLKASLSRQGAAGPENADRNKDNDKIVYAKSRRYPRHPVEGKNVNAHMFFSEEVVFRNLSVSGACILTIKDLQVGSRYILRIQGNDHTITIQCTVIWKHEHENNEEMYRGYMAGLTFISPSFEEIVRLKDFMRMYGEPDSQTTSGAYAPSALRYNIRDGKKALLNRHEVLGVKTISLGGMLIKSSRQMNVNGKYFMKIRLSSKGSPIKISGRIASVLPSSESNQMVYNIGVEFLDMEVPDKVQLEKFIQNI